MAERRMINKTIVDSDAFLDMPVSAQNLYFHLNVRADDEGFIDAPRKIMRTVSASTDDLKLLFAKRYLLSFESGVIVIKHWKLHNTIRKDRMKETLYLEEKATLYEKENGAYTDCQPDDNQTSTNCQRSIVEYSIEESSIEETPKRVRFSPPTLEEVTEYCQEKGVDAQKWYDHYTANGWKVGRNKMVDWQAAVRTWARNEFNQSQLKKYAVEKQDYHTRDNAKGRCLNCGQHRDLSRGFCSDCEGERR